MMCCEKPMIRGEIEHLGAGFTFTCNECGKQTEERSIDPTRAYSRAPFQVGFHPRGHGHGDFVVLDADSRLVAKLTTIYQCREAPMLAAAPSMMTYLMGIYDGDSEIKALLEEAGVPDEWFEQCS